MQLDLGSHRWKEFLPCPFCFSSVSFNLSHLEQFFFFIQGNNDTSKYLHRKNVSVWITCTGFFIKKRGLILVHCSQLSEQTTWPRLWLGSPPHCTIRKECAHSTSDYMCAIFVSAYKTTWKGRQHPSRKKQVWQAKPHIYMLFVLNASPHCTGWRENHLVTFMSQHALLAPGHCLESSMCG